MTEITVVEYNKGKPTQSQIEEAVIKTAKEKGLVQTPEFHENLISKMKDYEPAQFFRQIPKEEEKNLLEKSISLKDIVGLEDEKMQNYHFVVSECKQDKHMTKGTPSHNINISTIDKVEDKYKLLGLNSAGEVILCNKEVYTMDLSEKIANELNENIEKPSFDKNISEKLIDKSSIVLFCGPGWEGMVSPVFYETAKKKEMAPAKEGMFLTQYTLPKGGTISFDKHVFKHNLPGGIRQGEIYIGPLKHKENGKYWTMSELTEDDSSEKAYVVAGLIPIRNAVSLNRPDIEVGAVILPESIAKEILENSKKEELINLVDLSRVVHEKMGVTQRLNKTRRMDRISIVYDEYFM